MTSSIRPMNWEEYPDANVLSIKAMDASGKGQASDIYAAIQYALECKADVISLSLTANSSEENSAVVLAIEEAISKGVIVVGAAGNNASNAKYFIRIWMMQDRSSRFLRLRLPCWIRQQRRMLLIRIRSLPWWIR